MHDDFQRRLTAWMVAGFAYVLAVLAFVPSTTGDGRSTGVPATSALLATLVVVAALVTVLLAIRHAVTSLSLSALVRALADRALTTMRLPDRPDDEVPTVAPETGESDEVVSDVMGWVQHVDYPALLAAVPPDTRLTLYTPVGEFVARGDRIAVASRRLEDGAREAILAAVTVAPIRRGDVDLAFAIQQLVDVAEHATAPHSTDTSTADEALLHLRAVMQELLRHGTFSGCLNGTDGRSVISRELWHPADHLEVAFERLRRGVARFPTTVDRLLHTMDILVETAREVGDERSHETLQRQRQGLIDAAASHRW